MAKVFNVAKYILTEQGEMTAMKLQKLCYYAQAWSLVWEERPLFTARIEAWANGPVVPLLYQQHRGRFKLHRSDIDGEAKVLSDDDRETVDAVLSYYGAKSSQWLSELTHKERPWREARQGVAPGVRCARLITHAAMAEYYGAL